MISVPRKCKRKCFKLISMLKVANIDFKKRYGRGNVSSVDSLQRIETDMSLPDIENQCSQRRPPREVTEGLRWHLIVGLILVLTALLTVWFY